MAFYATGSSCSVLEELDFGSVEVMKTLSIRGSFEISSHATLLHCKYTALPARHTRRQK